METCKEKGPRRTPNAPSRHRSELTSPRSSPQQLQQQHQQQQQAAAHHESGMTISLLDKFAQFFAEFIGTGMLIFFGCMGCIEMEGIPNSRLQSTFTFGLTIMFIIDIFGHVSGAHLNPAVTAAAYIYKLVTLPMAGLYCVAQILGACLGFGLLVALVPSEAIRGENSTVGLCTTVRHPSVTLLQAIAIEYLCTMTLIMIICGLWDPRNSRNTATVTIKIGLAITALAGAGAPFSGAGMNPARSFGPAIWNRDFQDHWIYWLVPMSSAFITAGIYKAIFWREDKSKLIEDRNNA